MVKHIVMWKLKEDFDEIEKQEIAHNFKTKLEALDQLLPGILRVKVVIQPMDSSNVDILLDSEFDSVATLKAYQIHPKHQKVASYLKDKVVSRNCMDYMNESTLKDR